MQNKNKNKNKLRIKIILNVFDITLKNIKLKEFNKILLNYYLLKVIKDTGNRHTKDK